MVVYDIPTIKQKISDLGVNISDGIDGELSNLEKSWEGDHLEGEPSKVAGYFEERFKEEKIEDYRKIAIFFYERAIEKWESVDSFNIIPKKGMIEHYTKLRDKLKKL